MSTDGLRPCSLVSAQFPAAQLQHHEVGVDWPERSQRDTRNFLVRVRDHADLYAFVHARMADVARGLAGLGRERYQYAALLSDRHKPFAAARALQGVAASSTR